MIKSIIIIYFLIGFLKSVLLFIPQDISHRCEAIRRKKYCSLLFLMIFWLPMFLLNIMSYGIKRSFRYNTSGIRCIIKEYKNNKRLDNEYRRKDRNIIKNRRFKDSTINIVLFVIFLSLITYFIIIETWFLPVKIIMFIVSFLILKSVLFPKKQQSNNKHKSNMMLAKKDIKLFRIVCCIFCLISLFIALFLSKKIGAPLLALSLFFLFTPYSKGDKIG